MIELIVVPRFIRYFNVLPTYRISIKTSNPAQNPARPQNISTNMDIG
jgi:hypothetical protein